MVSIVGDPAKDLRLELFVDSDLAGDPNAKFSTSGVWFGVGGRAFQALIFGRQFSSGVLNSSFMRTTRR